MRTLVKFVLIHFVHTLDSFHMKFLVCISSVPDTTTKINFTNGTSLNSAGVQFIINPYDEISLTRAIELKETLGGTVTVVNVGSIGTEPVIRKALAVGADDAVRINAEPLDAYYVAFQLAEFAKKNQFDLIFTGRESIDYNSGQVGALLGELLELPSFCVVKKLDLNGNEALMEREIDGGKELVTSALPLVISSQKDLAEPRIPNMRGIMSARSKPLTIVEPVAVEGFTSSVKFDLPPQKKACQFIDPSKMDELVSLLHSEAKVI